MTDSQLIEELLNDDPKAFRRLADKYYPVVLQTAMGFLHNAADAEDICQDVFIEVYQSIKKFRKESKLSTWIYRITVNKSLNFIRKNKRNSLIENMESYVFGRKEKYNKDLPGGFVSGQETELEKNERTQVLHKAINSLSGNQKIAFTLSKYDDLANKEIAEIMNVSVSSVESLIHRAKLNLQKQLLSYFEKK